MERCDNCEYEYDGICTAIGAECNAIAVCSVITNKVREQILTTPTIGKEESEMAKSYEQTVDDKRKRSHETYSKMLCGVKEGKETILQDVYDGKTGKKIGKLVCVYDNKGDVGMEKKECKDCFGASFGDCDECEKGTHKEKNKASKHREENIKKWDNVNHPRHYEGHTSIECIDNMCLVFGNQKVADYCLINAYKYISRHKYKNRKEDLQKAQWYLDKYYSMHLSMETKFEDEKYTNMMELVQEGLENYENE